MVDWKYCVVWTIRDGRRSGTDRERFELSIPGSPVCRFSRPVPSTTRPPVLRSKSIGYAEPRQPRTMRRDERAELRSLYPSRFEKFFQHLPTFFGEHSALNFRGVVETWVAQNIADRSRHSRLRIPRTENYATDSGQHHRSSTHRARLEGHVKSAIIEAPAVQLRRRVTYRDQLGVRRSVLITHRAIVRCGDDRVIAHHNRSDRHFVLSRCVMGERNRVLHEALVDLSA